MTSYAPNMLDYFKISRQFYYLILDLNGSCSYINPLYAEKFRVNRSRLSIDSFGSATSNIDVKEHEAIVKQCLSNPGKPVNAEFRNFTGKGFIWTQWEFSILFDEYDEPEGIQGVGLDITMKKEKEKKDEPKIDQKLIDQEINKQKLLTQATIDGQEKEREQIGKELHDNIGQQLTTTKLFLDMAKSTADDATLEMINMSIKSVSDVINEIRGICRSLVPPSLGDLGLVESVNDLCESLRRTHTFNIRFYHENFNEAKLVSNQKLMLFRIIQEQINNIVKHAEAKHVALIISCEYNRLELVISDNGKGFNPKEIKKGIGLMNIANRVDLFNGRVDIRSTAGKGCRIKVTVPLK